jgi:chromosome segregation ATPase
MLEAYEWISDDKKFFGQPNTAYDFKANDPKEAGKQIKTLEEKQSKLEKSVNMRAMTMLGKAEEQYNDLIRKKVTVENDKAKIEQVRKRVRLHFERFFPQEIRDSNCLIFRLQGANPTTFEFTATTPAL